MRTIFGGVTVFILLAQGALPVYAQESEPAAQPPLRVEAGMERPRSASATVETERRAA